MFFFSILTFVMCYSILSNFWLFNVLLAYCNVFLEIESWLEIFDIWSNTFLRQKFFEQCYQINLLLSWGLL